MEADSHTKTRSFEGRRTHEPCNILQVCYRCFHISVSRGSVLRLVNHKPLPLASFEHDVLHRLIVRDLRRLQRSLNLPRSGNRCRTLLEL